MDSKPELLQFQEDLQERFLVKVNGLQQDVRVEQAKLVQDWMPDPDVAVPLKSKTASIWAIADLKDGSEVAWGIQADNVWILRCHCVVQLDGSVGSPFEFPEPHYLTLEELRSAGFGLVNELLRLSIEEVVE